MTRFLERLAMGGPLFWDGGMGSLLIAAGLKPGECPEAWNLERPTTIADIHRAYAAAGADVVQSNTFGGSAARLRETRSAHGVAELNGAGLALARAAVGPGTIVAGNMGPSGLSLPPLGKADEAELEALFFEQAWALQAAGADLISLETFSDLREALAALRAIRRAGDLPVVASMTFRASRRGFFTLMGDPVQGCMEALTGAGALAVGANCTLSGAAFTALAREIRRIAPGWIFLEPNAGEPTLVEGRVHYPESPETFAAALSEVLGWEKVILGGCCGTTPAHIAALVALQGGACASPGS